MSLDALLDIIEINKMIKDGHQDGTISYKNYSASVKPSITQFSSKYGTTPNKYLKEYLQPIYDGLPGGYDLKNFQHYGNNKLHEYVWACIYYKYPNVKSLYASSSPQLYVLVHSNGLKFGFDYGAQVENNVPLVQEVKNKEEIQNLIVKLNKSIPAYSLSQGADYLPSKRDLVSFASTKDVVDKWDNTIHFIKQFDTRSIPDLIEIEISNTLTELRTLFLKISELSIEKEIELSSKKPIINSEPFSIREFKKHIDSSGLFYSKQVLIRLVASLLSKPFVILSGLSGSGKTKLAQAFVQWICQEESQYRIIPVGADWTNREPLLGYPNALKPEEYVKPDSGVIDLILQANANPELPHFLILDEMNLSHVERYFADFLSVMESNEGIPLYDEKKEVKNGVPAKLKVPENLFIIGTVNIDETTNMFSPKVLDRANTIEFRINNSEMEGFLGTANDLNMKALLAKGANMAQNFISLSNNKSFTTKDRDEINGTLLNFFGELQKTGAEFGYRGASEILRLINQLDTLNQNMTTSEKIDVAIMQKLLPKLHGSRRKLSPILETLGSFCLTEDFKVVTDVFDKDDFDYSNDKVLYPLSLEKIARMYKGAVDNGFASYAEA